MHRIIDIFRFIIISLEAMWVGIIFVIYLYFNEYLQILGAQLIGNSNLWKTLYLLPIGFLMSSLKSTSGIRSPLDKNENKILYESNVYKKITDRVIYSLFQNIVCCIGMFAVWMFPAKLSEGAHGALFLIFVGISGISALTLILTEQKLKELLTLHT